MVSKIFALIFLICFSAYGQRYIEGDVIRTSDRTKFYSFPATSGTVATTSGTQTLVNKSIDALSNTITNIGNSEIAGGAEIQWSKMYDLTPLRVPILDATGNVSASTVTTTELGYLSGVTSAIQTQFSVKAPLASPTFTGTITTPLTASRALVTDGSSALSASSVTSTELGYLSGVTSNIQSQINSVSATAAAGGGGGGSITLGNLDAVGGTLKGASSTGSTLYMQSASASQSGLVNLTTQTFAGAKTFSSRADFPAGVSMTGGFISSPVSATFSTTSSNGGFVLTDSTDPTKKVVFNLGNISSGGTRIIAMPNTQGNLAFIDGSNQTWSSTPAFNGGFSIGGASTVGAAVSATSTAGTFNLFDRTGLVMNHSGAKRVQWDIDAAVSNTTVVLTTPSVSTTVVGHNIATTKGDLIAATASNALSRLAVGSNGNVLVASSTQTTGLAWVPMERTERAYIGGGGGGGECNSTPCTITSQSNSFLSSVTRSGTGVYVATIVTGIFSSQPSCVCSAVGPGGDARTLCGLAFSSATSFTMDTYIPAGGAPGAADARVNLICVGPR